ncbi:hypothetical protein [Capnocytophaga canis]|uniref:hypothetical protein n=1 Tax=Capnocytophaga canis TaxID=1848903 RepID=UPI0037D40E81
MNYIQLIEQFWVLNEEHCLTPNESKLYFALVHISNRFGWKNPFNQSNGRLANICGITEPTLIKARNVLKQYGLIDFVSEKGRRNNTIYKLKYLKNFSICDSISDSIFDSFSDSICDENRLDNIKHINKTKLNNSSFLEKKKQKTDICDFSDFEEISENQEPSAESQSPLKTEKIQKEKSSAKKEKGFDFLKALLNAGFDPELSAEWLKIRKAKKAVNSELAFKNFLREVEKSGRSPNEVLALIVQKQWKGFEASWLHNEQFTTNNGQKSNTTGNYTRANAGGGYPTGQKISARAFLAKQYSEQLARNSEAGNITIEVETSPSE